MAAWAGRWPDRVLSVVVLLLYSMPGFWVGLMAIVLFSVKLGWLPQRQQHDGRLRLHRLGLRSPTAPRISCCRRWRSPRSSSPSMPGWCAPRCSRCSGRTSCAPPHAKGLHPLLIQLRHALRNALIPVTTVAGMHLGNLLGGAVVVETLFGWPGMGRLALEAVLARDFSVLLGVLLLSSLLVIMANVLIDLLHAWLDPRIGEA